MCVYGPHFAVKCQCVYMVLTFPGDVNVCICSSLYLQMCMSVYGPHFTIRCECVYMVLTLSSDVYMFIWSSLYPDT